jgi:hypothetical protein
VQLRICRSDARTFSQPDSRGLDPAIHPFAKGMDPRVKPAGDARSWIKFTEYALQPFVAAVVERLVARTLARTKESALPLPCDSSPFRPQPRFAAGLGKLAHAQNVALPFGDRNHPARIEQVEDVTGLDALIISG